MKKITRLIFFLPFFCSAADWDLFQLNQKNFYTYQLNNRLNVDVQLMDSVTFNGVERDYFFRRNLNFDYGAACYHNAYTSLPLPSFSMPFIDYLAERNDSVFYSSYSSTLPFYFLPKATVGQSWTVTSTFSGNDYSQITITCSAIQPETFLGLTDSVKTFTMLPSGTSAGQTPVNNFVMKLSRRYGLIEFVPFELFLYHPSYFDFFGMTLNGIDSAGQVTGYHQPGLQDYFHLSAGDVLCWKRTVNPDDIMQPDWQAFYRDSITQVFASPDSVIYTMDVTRLDSHQVITQYTETATYRRENFKDLLDAPPSWVAFEKGPYLPWSWGLFNYLTVWQTGNLVLKTDSLTLDTLSEYSFGTEDWGMDTNNCHLLVITDVYHSFTLDTRMGVIEFCFYNFSYDCYSLTGAIIGGYHYGDSELPTGIESIENPSFYFAPNPFHEHVSLSGRYNQAMHGCSIKIFNTLGRLLREEKIPDMATYILQRGDLADGIYFYEISNEDYETVFSGKLVAN